MAIIQPGGSGSGGGFTNPMTTAGDLIVGGTGGAPTRLAAGSAGTFLGGAGTAYQLPPGHEIGYDQITANVNLTGTSSASPTSVIVSTAYMFDGSAVIYEFYSPLVRVDTSVAGNATFLGLYESGSLVAQIAQVQTPSVTAPMGVPVMARLRFTPTAGSHTYTTSGWVSVNTGTPLVGAGAGSGGANVPAYVRFTKV